MMYCEICRVAVAEGGECPMCGSRRLRRPFPHDLCFLVEKEAMWGDVLADVLKQHSILFFRRNVMGAGFSLKAGPHLERSRFYVPFFRLGDARILVEELFAGDDAPEPEQEP